MQYAIVLNFLIYQHNTNLSRCFLRQMMQTLSSLFSLVLVKIYESNFDCFCQSIYTYILVIMYSNNSNFEFNLLIHLLTTKLVLFVSFKLITYTHAEHDYEIWNFVHITLYDTVGMLKLNHLMKEKKIWNSMNEMNLHAIIWTFMYVRYFYWEEWFLLRS